MPLFVNVFLILVTILFELHVILKSNRNLIIVGIVDYI